MTIEGVKPLQPDNTSRGSRDALTTRDKFAHFNYFITTEGVVPWQFRRI